MAFKDKSPSKATVYLRFDEFKGGRVTLANEEQRSRSLTAVTEENVLAEINSEVATAVSSKRPNTEPPLQHNLPAPATLKTRDFLECTPIKVIRHPPHSSGSVLCDFLMFKNKKIRSREKCVPHRNSGWATLEKTVEKVTDETKKCILKFGLDG
ncbi:hypothetical protein EVAR_53006_1 [Eumeta japonica]|uniref:Histone-lysine N-methyltransferase SETMAR n=1 Tax=Eumeta variegata TaxID=151549 RepID=A0A4C1YN78_EUMVA|nr:hypothetical protein EVAR_53006_1 [Eumeta japonica]